MYQLFVISLLCQINAQGSIASRYHLLSIFHRKSFVIMTIPVSAKNGMNETNV
jgi:hypothetical protein